MMLPLITINSGQCLHRGEGAHPLLSAVRAPGTQQEKTSLSTLSRQPIYNRRVRTRQLHWRFSASVLRELLLHPDILDIVKQEFDLPAEIVRTKSSQHYQRDVAGIRLV